LTAETRKKGNRRKLKKRNKGICALFGKGETRLHYVESAKKMLPASRR